MLPIERLGRWSRDRFVAVAQHSVDVERVFVITHGWAPGTRSAVAAATDEVLVWDERATSSAGKRFDGWIRDLAAAIEAQVPESAVLCYSWIDESATKSGKIRAIQSQRRTTINGQRLAVALQQALSEESEARVHLIGYSHGARVATVAATVLTPPPSHLTLLDSPDGLLPVLGGGLNDLSALLRVAIHRTRDGVGVRIDNYPSAFGIRYGRQPGLERILDVVLDPSDRTAASESGVGAIVANSLSEGHRYAPEWYANTAERGLPVGFGWSAIAGGGVFPGAGESRQDDPEDQFALTFEPREAVPIEPRFGYSLRRAGGEATTLATEGGTATYRSMAWRTRGDQFAVVPIRWLDGDGNAELRIWLAGRERASSRKGRSDNPEQEIALPIGDIRHGPMSVAIELTADRPASVEIGGTTGVHQFHLPAFAELHSWLFPLSIATLAGTLGGLVATSLLRFRRARRRRSGLSGDR